jgi:hypothetical protein
VTSETWNLYQLGNSCRVLHPQIERMAGTKIKSAPKTIVLNSSTCQTEQGIDLLPKIAS